MSELFSVGCENPHRNGDVIFIHGLGGDAWGTWHSQNQRDRSNCDFWLTWLQEDLTEKGIDVAVWTFGYDAAHFQFSGSADFDMDFF
jgi:protein SERAC1